ncbi:Ribonuclease III (EC 3.1.26.3) [uncultured Gammaproteobacteria bacterium]|uniref:ribonuclease III n=1 Tax=Bathymodiolus heckerae thiotrophic gill symbiont TaxID=1052212 RepID=UPI0010BBE4BF|nr:ribonuclease III [Bathymodiolus heckerae thiotrophic gill symbiont]CAC9542511.1 Ribonuclease III (EC 3.1.26.3) [uncultured Gammaproteobacteria bacterium]CAC9957544.1 Ribonuclease III (EC 3.1.26.3) [uncultured Gammaproteobacteria bacterium]SHN90024.1 Ribonuclease III [Bathymodiolus heckerae thiotrophic gill symbiont]
MEKLQQKLNYQFKDTSLLKLALTHRSVGRKNNERLEFLGDSILGLVISRELYKRFTQVEEGKLSRLRSRLVRGQTLAQFGLALQLSDVLILGSGELKSGGYRRESIQADAVEAIFGAILLDSDFETISIIILDLFKDLLDNIDPNDSLKDPKTLLQEYLQKRNSTLPKYELIKTVGKDHNAIFTVNCLLEDQKMQVDQDAKSIKRAEQSCAQALLDKLQERK